MRILYDSVDGENIPDTATLMAGYNDHAGLSYNVMRARFPHATVVPICIDPAHDATILDVETLDARPDQIPGWVARQRARGQEPTVYCSLALWPTCRAACAGTVEPQWWIASYGLGPTSIGGAVAHQYADMGPYDLSVVQPYWPGVDPKPAPPDPPAPLEDENMPGYVVIYNGGEWFVAADLASRTGLAEGSDATELINTGKAISLALSAATMARIPDVTVWPAPAATEAPAALTSASPPVLTPSTVEPDAPTP